MPAGAAGGHNLAGEKVIGIQVRARHSGPLECHTCVAAWVPMDGEMVSREAGMAVMGYTPKHAKPGSLKEAGMSGHEAVAVTAPSVGRHAAPENAPRRKRGLVPAARSGKI